MKKLEIFFKNILLNILLSLSGSRKNHEALKITGDSRLLFVRLNRIGDALISTALLKLVKEKYNCHITVLADQKNYFIFKNKKIVDEIFIYRKGFRGLRELIRTINAGKFDAVIDLHDDVSTTVSFIIAAVKINYKLGLRKSNSKIYTATVEKPDAETTHVIDRLRPLAAILGIDTPNTNMNVFYEPKESSVKSCKEYLANNYTGKKFLVGINISAGSKARFWGIQRFKKLLEALSKYDLNIILMCTKDDLAYAMSIAENNYKIFYRPDFDEFAGMIPNLDLLFTPDTSIIHLASAYSVPVFGLYVKYNTNNMIWYPYKSKYEAVITDDPTLENMGFDTVIKKFLPFFENLYEKRNSKMQKI